MSPSAKYYERCEGSALIRGGEVFTSFCSSDFLGFAQDERVFQAFRDGLGLENELLTGTLASAGGRPVHKRLEVRLSAFRGAATSRIFSSFEALLFQILKGLEQKSHALLLSSSLSPETLEAFSVSGLETDFFDSAEPDSLEEKLSRNYLLKSNPSRLKVSVICESLSVHNGRVAPLRAIQRVCETASAELLVDDSYAVGVLGLVGSGGLEKAGITDAKVLSFFDFRHTLSSVGAAVTGPRSNLEKLLPQDEASTLLPAPLVYLLESAIGLIELEVRARSRLRAKSLQIRDGLASMGFRVDGNPVSPIVLLKEEPLLVEQLVRGLYERKILVQSTSRGLRIIARSIHSSAEIVSLLQALDDIKNILEK